MSFLGKVAGLGRHQARNLFNLMRGYPVTTPSLGSMTLDWDDVEIARHWLQDRSLWHDENIVKEYEQKFALWNGSQFAFAFMGGRVALSACIYALDLKPGDEVILPGYTCVVVPNALQYAGIKPVYADIELETYGLDVGQIEKKISSKTKAILLHHLYGLVCRDYEAILRLAKSYNLRVIEDCAHATGAEYKGKKVGNWGDVAFYSSEQSKIFTTIQGGVAVTNDPDLASKMQFYYDNAPIQSAVWASKQLKNLILNFYQFKHPKRWLLGDVAEIIYGHDRLVSTTKEEEQGIKPIHYGSRMSAPIAVIGINQLKKIDSYNKIRRQTSLYWDSWCESNNYKKPLVVNNSVPVFLRYPVQVEEEKKKNIAWASKELGINLGVWFVSNIHPVQSNLADCPLANQAVRQCVNFPCIVR